MFDPGATHSIEEFIRSAARDADPLANTVRALGDHSPQVRGFVSLGLPFNSSACSSESGFQDLHSYNNYVAQRDGAAWMDNTTIVTAAVLMSDSGPNAMTPLTVWDLATFARAVVSYSHIYHHEHPDIDDYQINRSLGSDVLKPLPLPTKPTPANSPLPEPWDGAHRFMCEVWEAAYSWLRRLNERAGSPTLDGTQLAAVCDAWSRALHRDDLNDKDLVNWRDVSHRWTSPSNVLLTDMADATDIADTYIYIDPKEDFRELDRQDGEFALKSSRKRLGELLSDLNLRSYVNQRLADFFRLPYVPAAARVPFRKYLYDRAVTIQQRLTAADMLENRYAELAKGVVLRLPMFLALAVRKSQAPTDLWDQLKDLREAASKYRARRVEVDAALARNDLKEVARVSKALSTDVESVLGFAGQATVAASGAIVEEVAKGDVTHVALGVAAIEAVSKKFLSSSTADRLLWRLRRPYLLWINDLVDEASHITEALPDFARIWKIPENQQNIFAVRFAEMAKLQAVGNFT